jgi:hypothetical protein
METRVYAMMDTTMMEQLYYVNHAIFLVKLVLVPLLISVYFVKPPILEYIHLIRVPAYQVYLIKYFLKNN